VLVSASAAARLGVPPLASWVGAHAAGVNPRTMGIGPVPAIERLLERHALTLDDIDLFEINEAFAAQVLGVVSRLGPGEAMLDRVNVNGGAIALGHPLGASGARLVATLVHELKRSGGRRGIASLCVGVGQGVATLFEAV
jgi:acetyl-CoA acetyltransferase family protein